MIPETFPSLYGKIHFPFAEFLGQGEKRKKMPTLTIFKMSFCFFHRF